MKKLLLIVFVSLFCSVNTFAQRTCGTMENLELLKSQDPFYTHAMERIEEQTKLFIAENGGSSRAVYNIPVVVHVVYNTSSQNISDTQIQSQIKILTDDFRRLNADKSNTPSTFTSVAADSEVNFCLATVAPNGSATNGITRTSTSVTSFDHTDKMKYNSSGGKDAWPTGSYLNIWVCNLGGGLLGYAQFPGGTAATDGVVVGYNYFGNTGTATAPFNKGRTATHEVGHWLNLRHIWGDSSCGNDLVSDTPVHTTSNSGCPSHPKANSCGTSAEMHMNYMDYSDDACMNMFTTGQKTRMHAVLASGGARASLASSAGCGGGSTTTSYCSASGANAAYEWISNVNLNTINNSSNANGGYADFTSISTNLERGKSYTISMTPTFASSTYSEYFKVFIDWNNDSDFADSGELVYSSAGTTTTVSGSFTVPSTATLAKTRMRVIMKDGSISGPCEQFTYGEVEDYSVNIVAAVAACTTPGNLTTSNITTSGTTLNWGSTGAASYGVRYKKTSTTTWTNTTSSTNSKIISGLTASTQYEFQVRSVCSSTSSSAYSASRIFTTGSATTSNTITIGAGTSSTGIAPYGTYYMDERVQFIITKAELDAAGYTSTNNVLKSLGFNIASLSNQTMNAFTIKIAHTSASSFGTTSFLAPSMSTVYSANFTPVSGWNTHIFSTPFSYNGSGNLLIDICWNNSSYTTDSKVTFTSQSSYKTLYRKADVTSGGVCSNTTGTRSYERPNIRITLSSSTTARFDDTETETEEAELFSENGTFNFNVYPNPVTTDLSVNYTLSKDNMEVIITVYNLMGSVIEQRNLSSQSFGEHTEKLNLSANQSFSALSSGIYLISINIDGQIQTKRFVLDK
ncbi:MAG: GEVED domain-containing protein [Bacteroidota bacterium]|nr:GEVED domain-containing protein [Bacteroidota bacterium]